MSNIVYCDERFRARWPEGHEEKTCVHGIWGATCSGRGKTRKLDEKPYWHCLGTATTHGSAPAAT